MKQLTSAIVIPLMLLLCCCGNRTSSDNKSRTNGAVKLDSIVFHDTLYHDTFFIYRYLDSDFYRAVYLSKDKENSDVYKQLEKFNLDSSDLKNIVEHCKYAQGSLEIPIKKFDLMGLQGDWLPVVLYKKKYYLYTAVLSKKILTDSVLMYETQDGYYCSMLQSLTKKNPNEYTIGYDDYFSEKLTKGLINIYILNPNTKLSIWEEIVNGTHEYALRIPKESAKNYDLIADEGTGESDDYKFERVDFKKLIRESQGQK